jgi:hypothetical protein
MTTRWGYHPPTRHGPPRCALRTAVGPGEWGQAPGVCGRHCRVRAEGRRDPRGASEGQHQSQGHTSVVAARAPGALLRVVRLTSTRRRCARTSRPESARPAHEGRAGQAGDRSGRPCDPAAIEDVWPGHPAEAWTGLFPARLRLVSVSRLGHLTRLERPPPSRRRDAAAALRGTAGASPDAGTRESPDEALPWTPELLDRHQPRRAVRAVPRWWVDVA